MWKNLELRSQELQEIRRSGDSGDQEIRRSGDQEIRAERVGVSANAEALMNRLLIQREELPKIGKQVSAHSATPATPDS